MKELQARTKVVLRHLPPSMPQDLLLEHIDSKFAGCYSWFSFRPGKASVKKQILSRAYINFKRPEDVQDFCEDFDGHVFVNEKGAQYKVAIEYAPYQRIPKPRSKKDIREGTIAKDPDYLEFLEMLEKPLEYLPSAEVQLERREAEKAAVIGPVGGKESVVVTPLMEYVRQRRAAKATPQRPLSSKVTTRGVNVISSSLASQKRGLERSRSGTLMDFKEVQARDHTGLQRREERREREVVIERRKKEMIEAREKRLGHDLVSTVQSTVKGNAETFHHEIGKANASVAVLSRNPLEPLMDGETKACGVLAVDVEKVHSSSPGTGKQGNEGIIGDVTKELNKREIRRKQLTVMKDKSLKDNGNSPTSSSQGAGGGSHSQNQRHRPSASHRITSSGMPFAASVESSTAVVASKSNHRRDLLGKSSSRGCLSPKDQQSPSRQHGPSHIALALDCQSMQSSPQSDRGGKRPPRHQNIRSTGKEQVELATEPEVGSVTNNETKAGSYNPTDDKVNDVSSLESFSGTDRQDARRVRNKDRPDRPVWTPRRRSDLVQGPDASCSVSVMPTLASSDVTDIGEPTPKQERSERGSQRLAGKSGGSTGQMFVENIADSQFEAGQQQDGAKSQSVSGSGVDFNSVSGKVKHFESGSALVSRGARSSSSNLSAKQEHKLMLHQGDQRSDPYILGKTSELRAFQSSTVSTKESGESNFAAGHDKEKRKQDAIQWNEAAGCPSHRSGERRRDRNAHHVSRDSDEAVAAAELNKPVKRGASLSSGNSEKQVWVAVQKSGSGT